MVMLPDLKTLINCSNVGVDDSNSARDELLLLFGDETIVLFEVTVDNYRSEKCFYS